MKFTASKYEYTGGVLQKIIDEYQEFGSHAGARVVICCRYCRKLICYIGEVTVYDDEFYAVKNEVIDHHEFRTKD